MSVMTTPRSRVEPQVSLKAGLPGPGEVEILNLSGTMLRTQATSTAEHPRRRSLPEPLYTISAPCLSSSAELESR